MYSLLNRISDSVTVISLVVGLVSKVQFRTKLNETIYEKCIIRRPYETTIRVKYTTDLSSHLICTQPGLRMKDHGWYHFSTTSTQEQSVSSQRCNTCSLQFQKNLSHQSLGARSQKVH